VPVARTVVLTDRDDTVNELTTAPRGRSTPPTTARFRSAQSGSAAVAETR
jgi:hypothetical protein